MKIRQFQKHEKELKLCHGIKIEHPNSFYIFTLTTTSVKKFLICHRNNFHLLKKDH